MTPTTAMSILGNWSTYSLMEVDSQCKAINDSISRGKLLPAQCRSSHSINSNHCIYKRNIGFHDFNIFVVYWESLKFYESLFNI